MMEILFGLMNRLGVTAGVFSPLQPSGCHTNVADESGMAEPTVAALSTPRHNTLGVQEQATSSGSGLQVDQELTMPGHTQTTIYNKGKATTSEYGPLVGFPGMTDVGPLHINFDKMGVDFIFEPRFAPQLPQDIPQLGIPNELYGFDRGTF